MGLGVGANFRVSKLGTTTSMEYVLTFQPMRLSSSKMPYVNFPPSINARYRADRSEIWTQDTASSCRGLIATGFDLRQFDVALTGEPSYQIKKHNAWDCGTAYCEDPERGSQNPIVGTFFPMTLSANTPD